MRSNIISINERSKDRDLLSVFYYLCVRMLSEV
jgi:hypothetical protein